MLDEEVLAKSPECVNVKKTYREILIEKRDNLKLKLEEINVAIKTLDANPGTEKVLNALSKVLRRL